MHRLLEHSANQLERDTELTAWLHTIVSRYSTAPNVTAALTGFTDQSHLHRHFRRALGFTPGQYQRPVTRAPRRR